MKYLGVEEITTPKQQNNGTREFALPYKIINREGELRTWTNKRRMMIYGEKNRIDFIFNYILKNYYNKQWQK